jgi:hypothetical protein
MERTWHYMKDQARRRTVQNQAQIIGLQGFRNARNPHTRHRFQTA